MVIYKINFHPLTYEFGISLCVNFRKWWNIKFIEDTAVLTDSILTCFVHFKVTKMI
jgi:hypothetical protein